MVFFAIYIKNVWRKLNVLDFIEKHKFGILGTIALHVIVFIWLNIQIVEYGVYQPKERIVATLDYTQDEEIEEQPEENFDENGNPIESNLMNVAANADQEKTSYTNQNFSKSQADQDVWNELKQLEANEYNSINKNKSNEDNNKDTEESNEKVIDKNLIKKDADKNDNASYGKDTKAVATYSLEGRTPLQDDAPSYKCRAEGVVVIDIKVNQKGEVILRTINESRTTTQNDCLRTEALNYSKRWRFTQDFNDAIRKSGWIKFTYVAQ